MNKRLSSDVHHIVIRVTDYYLPETKGDWHPIEKSDTLEQNLAFSIIRYLKKVWLLVVVSLLMLPGQSMAEETMCRDLKPVNNLDELLYQFYINLDSDCLFTTPLSELEATWGIKILSKERLQPGQTLYELRMGSDFSGKSSLSDVDAFYVEVIRNSNENKSVEFQIIITDEYYQTHGTLFPDGNFPNLLPRPSQKDDLEGFPYRGGGHHEPHLRNTGEYNKRFIYYWLNSDRTRFIYFTPNPNNGIGRIVMPRKPRAELLDYLIEE